MDTYYEQTTDTMQDAHTHAHARGYDDAHVLPRVRTLDVDLSDDDAWLGYHMPDDQQSVWAQ